MPNSLQLPIFLPDLLRETEAVSFFFKGLALWKCLMGSNSINPGQSQNYNPANFNWAPGSNAYMPLPSLFVVALVTLSSMSSQITPLTTFAPGTSGFKLLQHQCPPKYSPMWPLTPPLWLKVQSSHAPAQLEESADSLPAHKASEIWLLSGKDWVWGATEEAARSSAWGWGQGGGRLWGEVTFRLQLEGVKARPQERAQKQALHHGQGPRVSKSLPQNCCPSGVRLRHTWHPHRTSCWTTDSHSKGTFFPLLK